jgi:hypothetical protein
MRAGATSPLVPGMAERMEWEQPGGVGSQRTPGLARGQGEPRAEWHLTVSAVCELGVREPLPLGGCSGPDACRAHWRLCDALDRPWPHGVVSRGRMADGRWRAPWHAGRARSVRGVFVKRDLAEARSLVAAVRWPR